MPVNLACCPARTRGLTGRLAAGRALRDDAGHRLVTAGRSPPIQADEDRRDLRIELGARVATDLVQGLLVRQGCAMRTRLAHCCVGVGHGQEAGSQRDAGAAESMRVAVTGEAFVMVEDDLCSIPQAARLLEHQLPDAGMLGHELPLVLAERTRVRENLRRHRRHPGVVEHGRDTNAIDVGLWQTQLVGHLNDCRECVPTRFGPPPK